MRTAVTFGWGLVFAALPTLAQPALQFTAIRALASNQVELVWSSDTNRLFAIERTADPGDWDNASCVAIPEPSAQFASNRWTGAMDTTPAFFRLLASPPLNPSVVCHTNLGTPADDTQIVVGTTNRDYVMQFGNGGEDTQYASTGDGNDWIFQTGGAGSDTQTGRGGAGNDCICLESGGGNDGQNCQGADGEDRIVVQSGTGDDELAVTCGNGADNLLADAGGGDDSIYADGGGGDDTLHIYGGSGNDAITYDASPGLDGVAVDGGADTDALTVNERNAPHFVIQLGDGTTLYSNGPPGTLITVTNVEFISVVGTNGLTNWSWTSP